MQVRGKTLRCFSVILAFSKSLHETCRLLRALHTFFFLQAVYLGLTLAGHSGCMFQQENRDCPGNFPSYTQNRTA